MFGNPGCRAGRFDAGQIEIASQAAQERLRQGTSIARFGRSLSISGPKIIADKRAAGAASWEESLSGRGFR